MARYTSLFTVSIPEPDFRAALVQVLESCNFNIIYQTADYLMAREIPGNVVYSKLVTVEVLMDRTIPINQDIRMNLVVKNEELPLQTQNHCRQTFDDISKAIAEHAGWKFLESVAG
jgi:hypothetical protein